MLTLQHYNTTFNTTAVEGATKHYVRVRAEEAKGLADMLIIGR